MDWAGCEFVDPFFIDVEANDELLLAEIEGERKAHISEANDGEPEIDELMQFSVHEMQFPFLLTIAPAFCLYQLNAPSGIYEHQ